MNAVTETPELEAAVAAVEAASAPLFVTVPDVTLPNGTLVPSFTVGTFLASKGADGLAIVSAVDAPWVDINYFEAVAACVAAGGKLLTELQALAIAHDIAGVARSWTSGAVRVGDLKQGLRNGDVDEAQPGAFVPEDASEDRWFYLSNGERICDAAGNAYTWIFDDVQGDERGIVAKAFASDSPSVNTAPMASYMNGMGWFPDAGSDWSGAALVRGGCWCSEDVAGVFRLNLDWPDYARDHVGFRYTK